MSGQIKKVAVAGGTGNLGPAIVKELVDAGFSVTVLTRSESSSSPSGATTKQVDYNDPASLASALEGIDAVVSNLGAPALSLQTALIDASIKAGVSRFIPSEFGCQTTNEKTSQLAVFGAKVSTQKYLAEKASEDKISYTLVFTGAFLDWGIKVGFVANVSGGTTTLYDGGDVKFSATTLSGIGKAVAGVLKHPAETKNRPVLVASAAVTQNQLLAAAKKAKPGLETKTDPKDTAEIEKNSNEVIKSGKGDIGAAFYGLVRRGIWGPGYGGHFTKTDNELLGVPSLSEKQVEELVAGIV